MTFFERSGVPLMDAEWPETAALLVNEEELSAN